MKESGEWLAFIGGLIVGCFLGGTLTYVVLLKRVQTVIKTFAYDDAGRLIQVMREYGV